MRVLKSKFFFSPLLLLLARRSLGEAGGEGLGRSGSEKLLSSNEMRYNTFMTIHFDEDKQRQKLEELHEQEE